MTRLGLSSFAFLAIAALPQRALAVSSAELYTADSYGYGRVEARLRFGAGDGVVSSFFLWKDGSERAGTFWNELDFEKVGADCHLETNPLYGNPAKVHSQRHMLAADLCGAFHVYAYEWTPDYIAWSVDGVEIRRETGEAPMAYAANASAGMQIHFNIWPGDASFGGNFSPAILPLHAYIDWVQFSSYANGAFTMTWREAFDGAALPAGWLTGNWSSAKNLSTHNAGNVNFVDGYAVLSLTADDAVGPAGAMPGDSGSGGAATGGSAAGGSTATTNPGGAAGSSATSTAGATTSMAGASAPKSAGGCNLATSGVPGGEPASLGIAVLAGLLRSRRRARAVKSRRGRS